MKIYLSGPMTGIPEGNRPLFHLETLRLRELGFDIVNPAENDDESETRSYSDCLRTDLRQLLDCDAIAMLPCWYDSKGANIEYQLARDIGLTLFNVSDLV